MHKAPVQTLQNKYKTTRVEMVRIYGTHILMSTIVTGGVIPYNMDGYCGIFLTGFAFNAIRIFRFVNIKLNIINLLK